VTLEARACTRDPRCKQPASLLQLAKTARPASAWPHAHELIKHTPLTSVPAHGCGCVVVVVGGDVVVVDDVVLVVVDVVLDVVVEDGTGGSVVVVVVVVELVPPVTDRPGTARRDASTTRAEQGGQGRTRQAR
jgi:hypothetical protein